MIKVFLLLMWMNCMYANFEEDKRKFTIFRRDGGYEKVIQILTNLYDSKESEKKEKEIIAKDQLILQDEPLELINSTEMSVNRNFQDQLFEGDIVLTLNQALSLPQLSDLDSQFNRFKRKIINNLTAMWPNGIINYDYDTYIGEHKKIFIEAAINHWSVNTCLKFRKLPVGDYLLFVEGSGCYSNVGRIGGKQEISVGKGCDGLGVIAHEIGHTLGIWHEQSRPDRDKYIKINFDNVIPSARNNFFKLPPKYLNAYGIIYDLGSVMHYGAKAFTRNGDLATIETLDPNYFYTIGQRNMLSFTDIKQINAAYCSSRML
uniref:Metalloendopeptidase n=1 Tax=Romanomermis culicivorax TaxID=13658 RepID=A0A915HVE8_ROMCU